MTRKLLLAAMCSAWLCTSSAYGTSPLPMPSLELRQEAHAAYAQNNRADAYAALLGAMNIARAQTVPYVKANELRYIAESWAKINRPIKAREAFAEAMDAAIAIPTWNHRLYASIGVVETQRRSGDLDGTHANGIKALDSGLMEAVAQTGEAAEMGRFFTALDGLLSEAERAAITQRIHAINSEEFRRKALHALGNGKDIRYEK